MPDPQQKLVQVPDIGVVAFPGDMEDAHVANFIKLARAKKKFSSLTTEESEHQKQLKPAQSLSTAIPTLPDWAKTPLVAGPDDPGVEAIAPDPKRSAVANEKLLKTTQPARIWLGEHPKTSSALDIGVGVGQGVAGTAQGLTSPANIALMIAAPESKILSALFTIQALRGSYKDANAAREAYLKGNNQEATRYATQAALGAGVGALAGAHAVKDIPVPEGVKEFAKSEEGSIGPQTPQLKPTTAYKAIDDTKPFFLKSENLIAEKMKGPMPAEDVHKMLLSNGVKPEEMKWTGLDELLQGKGKQKVTTQEIQEHMAGNNLQVQEVQKGQRKPTQWMESRDGILTTPEGYKIERIDSNGKYRATSTSGIVQLFDTVDEAKAKVDYWRKNSAEDEVMPKFSSYQLPGGENYRELLVTMPPQPPKELESVRQQYQEALDKSTALRDRIEETGHAGPDADRLMSEFKSARNEVDRIGKQLNALKVPTNQFRSNHWDEPNVLGHIRFNDRTGPKGEKILHLEELQSDWHQKGRAKGYREPKITELPNGYKVSPVPKGQYGGLFEVLDPNGKYVASGTEPEDAVFFALERLNEHNQEQSVPDAPFKKNWHELMLKRMIKYAADHGYDGISWTPGEEQAERYDLSKQVSELRYKKEADGNYRINAYMAEGGKEDLGVISAEKLADTLGKEVAKKIINGEGEDSPGERKRLVGEDLKVGGSGMRGFYDKIIPDAANKLGKQWSSKVGETQIPTEIPPEPEWESIRKSDLPEGFASAYEWHYASKNGFKNTVGIYEGENGDWWAYKDGDELVSEVPKEQALNEAIKAAKEDIQGEKSTRTVQYLPITPQMRTGVKGVPYSLFGVGAAALSLSQMKAKAQALQDQQKKAGETN